VYDGGKYGFCPSLGAAAAALEVAFLRRRKKSKPTTLAMARTPMTTGAAMAATGTDLFEELAVEGVDDAVEVDEVDDGLGVIGGVDEDVLFCWSAGVSLELVSCLLETYTRPILYCAHSSH
jgi:hypothetical protein